MKIYNNVGEIELACLHAGQFIQARSTTSMYFVDTPNAIGLKGSFVLANGNVAVPYKEMVNENI